MSSLPTSPRVFANFPSDRPGYRFSPIKAGELAAVRRVTADLSAALGSPRPVVRAILFDKRDGANWALGWHQDRTIEVAERVDVLGFSPFTGKQGRLHVAPPIDVVERMITVRLHVDAVDDNNAPLVVAPGSRAVGFVAESGIAAVVAACGEMSCLGPTGAVWLYATPILHRSARAFPGRRRRVLQCDRAGFDLPGGLRWSTDTSA
ncbi:phytanoyl-CoA dioxygenase family protein [Sphingomonas sp. RS2018]